MRSMQKISSILTTYLKRYWILFVILLATYFISRLNFNLPLIVLSIFFMYRFSSKIISGKFFDSQTFLAVASVFFYVVILQCVSLVTWLINHDFPLSLNILITFLAVLAVYYPLRKNLTTSKTSRIKTGDIIALGVVLTTLLVFIALPIKNTGLENKSSLIVLANYNVDDGSHLNMINVRLQNNVATTVDNKADNHLDIGVSYPSGWPAANASIIQAFRPSIQTGSETLIAYILMKVFWLLFLVFIFTRTIFSIFENFTKKPIKAAANVWIGLSSFLFTAWFLVDPFFFGFFSFLPQLITVPLFILTTMQLSSARKNEGHLLSHLALPVLLSVGAALSWFLLFPVFILAVILTLINRITNFGFATVIKELTVRVPSYILFYLFVIAALFAQLYMTLSGTKSGASSTLVDSLLLNGGINAYPVTFYALILMGLLLFAYFGVFKNNQDKIRAILNYSVVMLGFVSFIYLLQQYRIFGNLYYYFKTLNTLTVIAIIFAIIGIALAINLMQSKTSRYLAITASVTISLVILQFAYPNAPFARYAKGTRSISANTNQQIYDTLKNKATQSNYNDGVVTIFYPRDNAILNEVASTLVQSNKPYSLCYSGLKGASFAVNIKDFDPSIIDKNCSPKNRIVYYVDKSYVSSVKEKISSLNMGSRVNVIPIAE